MLFRSPQQIRNGSPLSFALMYTQQYTQQTSNLQITTLVQPLIETGPSPLAELRIREASTSAAIALCVPTYLVVRAAPRSALNHFSASGVTC